MARYRDEIRSYTAECMFKNHDSYMTRSQIDAIHTKVIRLYPEFVNNDEEVRRQGFVVGNYGY